jgi:hypothetical protein
MTQKTTINNERNLFFDALYPDPPADLWLEVRCIHPQTGQVRTLWGDAKQDFKQADTLNTEGYGVYFAPCLRAHKKGNAESATLLPALWVDVDCETDRDQHLAILRAFELPPSIILNSGGGWHAYWLLNQPFILADDTDKARIAQLLHGLFQALGGDRAYVKSVASVMRLPDSINTKPDRDSARVAFVDWHPDRRYQLSQFDWLSIEPHPNNQQVMNGHHALPPRTEQYLMSGAINGNRNAELFAAACQMRDAGYSQSDTERELIPRHVADATGGESMAAREKEAQATIVSAYSQPPREPIPSAREHAQFVIKQLVGEQKTERPSIQQIVEAVEACVHLNAVEWAEERQRLKALCHDGLKISDMDRLYHEKKRELERQRQQSYVDREGYVLIDGKIIYRKETYRGTFEKTVADWSATALHQTCQVDDDGKEAHHTTIQLQRGESIKQLEIPSDVFVDDVALRRFIGASAGAQYVVRAGMSKHLVPAIVQLSGEFPTHRHYNFIGWMQTDERWVYVSPSDCITANGKLAQPPAVELDQRLRDYGLQASSWEDSLQAFEAVINVLPDQLAPPLIAFGLLPVVQRFFPATATRPAVHLVGTSGSGKSEIASLLSSFYGDFSRDTPPAQWGDTINTVETLGYPLADALFWVDDYKSIYADEKTFTRFLQSYSRGMGRGRLTREAKVRHEKPCRGLILSTGETTIEGEMSVIARMLVLEVPPWEKRDPSGEALIHAERLRPHLSSVTAHFASWVAGRLDDGLKERLALMFAENVKTYQAKLSAEIGRQSNNDRVVKNWAVLRTVYQLLGEFLGDVTLPDWQDVIVESVRTLRQERASEVFLDILGQLIAGGQVVIDDMKNPREHVQGVTVIGYRDDSFVYLLPEIAFKEVSKVQTIPFNTTAIGMQLKEDGILLQGTNTLTVQRRIRGGRVRLWQLKSDFLGCDTCDAVTSEQ